MSDGYTYHRVIVPATKTAATFTASWTMKGEPFIGPRVSLTGEGTSPWRDVFARGPFTMPRCTCPTCREYRRQAVSP